jgi:hypothetical protein
MLQLKSKGDYPAGLIHAAAGLTGWDDRPFQIGEPIFPHMVVSPDDDLILVEIKDIRPGPFALQVRVVDVRHPSFIEIHGRREAFVQSRNVHMAGDVQEDLRVGKDQLPYSFGRLGNEVRRVHPLVEWK